MTRLVFPLTNDLSFDQRMQRIAGSLVEAGYDVTLLGFEKSWSVPLRPQPWKQKRLKLAFRTGKLFYVEFNLRLFWELLRGPYDAIGAVDLDTLPGAWWAARLRARPIAHDAHEYYTELPELVDRPRTRAVWLWMARTFYPVCSTIAR